MQYMSQGLPIAIIGYAMVFVVLCFLWGILELMRVVLAPKKPKSKPQPVQTVPVVAEPVAEPEEEQADEGELIAVLTAAVAASLNTSTYNLRIKSFKRSDTKNSAWSSASRNDAINKL